MPCIISNCGLRIASGYADRVDRIDLILPELSWPGTIPFAKHEFSLHLRGGGKGVKWWYRPYPATLLTNSDGVIIVISLITTVDAGVTNTVRVALTVTFIFS